MSTDKTRIRRAPPKFTGSARVTLAAFSLIGFVGSWNLIAHVENRQAQANGSSLPTLVPTAPVVIVPTLTPTPWPTIAPLLEFQPVPTLNSVANSTIDAAAETAINPVITLDIAPIQVAPLPTMAPLPAIPDMPAPPPPPPPPPPMPAGGWQNSGGS